MNDREMDRLIRGTYAGLRARGRSSHHRRPWLAAVAVAAAILAGLALGTALGRSRITPAAPTPVPMYSIAPTAQAGGAVPTPRTPMATSPGTGAAVAAEGDMWSKVRASVSDPVAVMTPTWLPAAVDRSVLNAVTSRGAGDSYEVGYGSASSAAVTFTMGATKPEPAGPSGVGLKVRGHPTVLSSDPGAYSRSGLPKLLSWTEQGRHYGIRSETLSGDDLMRIAWSMETERPSFRPFPYARERVGTCSRPGMEADIVVRRLLSAVGSGDAATIADCFALEALESAPDAWRGWASLPRARDVVVRDAYWFGGRQIVAVSWTFERDPGGAWNPAPFQFFMVGLDDDRLRVYDVWTAPASLPR